MFVDTQEHFQSLFYEHKQVSHHTRQKKQIWIIAFLTVILLLLAILGGIILFLPKTAVPHSKTPTMRKVVNPVKEASAQTFGVSHQLSSDRHTVTFTISHATAITHITYALTYLVPNAERKGIVGDIDVPANQSTITSPAIPFGTCKNTVCTYDTDIYQTQLILTITKASGGKFQVIEPVNL